MSPNSIMQSIQRSSRWLAMLAGAALLLAGCNGQSYHGPMGHPPARLALTPVLLAVGVFFLILFIKRPWRVLGGLCLAFVVFAFLGLAIPVWHVRRNAVMQTYQHGGVVVHEHYASQPAPVVHSEAYVDSVRKTVALSGDDHEIVVHAEAAEAAPRAEAAAHAEATAEPAHAAERSAEAPSAVPAPAPEASISAPPAPPTPEPQPPVAAALLEVPAGATVVKEAPGWIHEPWHFDPKTHCYVEVVRTGTATTAFELKHKLDERLADVTRAYLTDTFGPQAENMHVPLDYLHQKVVKQQHTETIRRQFDAPAGFDDPAAVTHVQETWARLEFGPEVKRDLALMWDQEVAQRRLWQVGGLGGLVMAVLASALGYLRLDTATKGYYTRTLRWGAATVILGLVAAGLLLAG